MKLRIRIIGIGSHTKIWKPKNRLRYNVSIKTVYIKSAVHEGLKKLCPQCRTAGGICAWFFCNSGLAFELVM